MKSFKNRLFAIMLCVAMLVSGISVFADNSKVDDEGLSDAPFYAYLGEEPVTKNMQVWMGDKNEPETMSDGVRTAWILDPSLGNDARFIYAKLDTNYSTSRDNSNLAVTVEYFDEGVSSLTLEYPQYTTYNNGYGKRQYNKVENLYKNTELDYLVFNDTKTWKKHTWLVPRPALNKGISGGDFRIGIYSDTMGVSLGGKVQISSITVQPTGEYGIVDMAVESDHIGNIFWTDQKMQFKVSFEGKSDTLVGNKHTLDVTYELLDSDKKVVDTVTDKVTLNGNGKTYGKRFTVKPDKYGLYTLKVTARSEKAKIYNEYQVMCSYIKTTYGKVRNDKHWISFSGSMAGEVLEDSMKVINYAGFTGIRTNNSTGQMGLSSYDGVDANEITMMPPVNEWHKVAAKYDLDITTYSGCSDNNPAPQNNIEPGGGAAPKTDAGRERLWQFDKELLDRQGDAIDVFQINNEMDLRADASGDKNATAYSDYLKYVIPKVKKEYPDMPLLVGETSGLKTEWWENFLNTGVVEDADILGFHLYSWSGIPTTSIPASYSDFYHNISGLKKLLADRGLTDKELWVTEYGYSAFHGTPTSEYLQGCYDIQSYMLYENQLDKMILFQFSNGRTALRTEREHNFGVTKSRFKLDIKDFGAAKEKLAMFSAMNIEMADAEFVSRTDKSSTSVVRFKRTGKQKDMIVAFSGADSDTFNVDLGTKAVTCMDPYGNEYEVASINGIYSFNVCEAPLYIKGNFAKYEILDGSEAASVYVDAMSKQVSYNDRAEFTFVNNTGKDLKIEVEQLPGSLATLVENTDLKGEEGKIAFEFPSSALKGFERIKITIKDGDTIYFKNELSVEYNEPVGISFATRIDDNKDWWMDVEVANNSSIHTFDGAIEVTSPTSWAGKLPAQSLKIAPNTVEKLSIKLTCREANQSRVNTGISFVTTDGKVFSQSESVSFAYAPRVEGEVKIDGDLSEWTDGWMYLDQQEQFVPVVGYAGIYQGRDDIWGKAAVKWDLDYFYFAAEVHDDVFCGTGVNESALWSIDGWQIGLVYDPHDTMSTSAFEELAIALLDGKPSIYRHKTAMSLADSSVVEGAEMAFVNNDTVTTYEMRIPWTSLITDYGKGGEASKLKAGNELKFEAIINENDGSGRKGYYELAGGVGGVKSSGLFTKLYLTE